MFASSFIGLCPVLSKSKPVTRLGWRIFWGPLKSQWIGVQKIALSKVLVLKHGERLTLVDGRSGIHKDNGSDGDFHVRKLLSRRDQESCESDWRTPTREKENLSYR